MTFADKTCKANYQGAHLNATYHSSLFDTGYTTGKIRTTPHQAPATQLCLRMSSKGCNTYSTLCQGHTGGYPYAVSESSPHRCCPTCVDALSPPPTPLLPTIYSLYQCWDVICRAGCCYNATLGSIGIRLKEGGSGI